MFFVIDANTSEVLDGFVSYDEAATFIDTNGYFEILGPSDIDADKTAIYADTGEEQ